MKPYFSLFALLALVIVLAPSCQKDVPGCTDPEAENYNSEATTNDNSCTYERDKFLGMYDAEETCYYTYYDDYTLNVTAASNSINQIVIQNLYGLSDNVTATVNGNSFTFNSSEFSGSGVLNGNILTIDFEVGSFDECEVVAVKL